MLIRSVLDSDAPRIAQIYNWYIEHTVVSFEEIPVTSDEILARIHTVGKVSLPYLVMEDTHAGLKGFAYAGRWHARSAYRHTAETSIYFDQLFIGQGYGTVLYSALIEQLKSIGLHAVIGGVTLPNEASRKLHEKMGFQKVAHYSEVGFKFDQWLDVGYWQLTL